MQFKLHSDRCLRHWLSVPFIFPMIVPLVFLDLCGEIYHRACFPLYGLPYIKRSGYFRFDRRLLPYLNPAEKFFCSYCSYANGLMHYMTAIAGETERYWCGIKHAKYEDFLPPEHEHDFLPYNDEEAYRRFLAKQPVARPPKKP